MELAHILEELAYDMGDLPREAIEAAIAKRSQITPHLLYIVRDAVDRIDDVVECEDYSGHLYALYLLAQFREPGAYPLLLQLLSNEGDTPHSIFGDVLTEDLSRILASVCDNHIDPIKRLIENPRLNEYVRAAAQTSLVILVGCGILPRDSVVHYFQTLLNGKMERTPSFAWDNLVSCCCDLYPQEAYRSIEMAFREGLIDPCFISLEDVGGLLGEQKDNHLFRLFQNSELIDDTVTEMEKWLSAQPF